MADLKEFWWLLKQAVAVWELPFSILLGICAASGFVSAFAQRRALAEWKKRPSWLFGVYLVLFVLILGVPVLGGVRVDKHFPDRAAEFWINLLFLGSMAFSGYLTYRMKGLRWVAFSLAGCAEVALLSAF